MRREGSSVRNLRRPQPLTLPLPLHDCGAAAAAAAADLPGGRPRKPAGVSSAAAARPTSKPRLSVPSRAGATSVRTRLALKTQGRCWEGARSLGGAWARAAGPALPRSSPGLCWPSAIPRGGTLRTTLVRTRACLRHRGGRWSLPGEEPTWNGGGRRRRATHLPVPLPPRPVRAAPRAAFSTCSQVTTIEHAKSAGLL